LAFPAEKHAAPRPELHNLCLKVVYAQKFWGWVCRNQNPWNQHARSKTNFRKIYWNISMCFKYRSSHWKRESSSTRWAVPFGQ
jgi:hypothetical protein